MPKGHEGILELSYDVTQGVGSQTSPEDNVRKVATIRQHQTTPPSQFPYVFEGEVKLSLETFIYGNC